MIITETQIAIQRSSSWATNQLNGGRGELSWITLNKGAWVQDNLCPFSIIFYACNRICRNKCFCLLHRWKEFLRLPRDVKCCPELFSTLSFLVLSKDVQRIRLDWMPSTAHFPAVPKKRRCVFKIEFGVVQCTYKLNIIVLGRLISGARYSD